MKDLENIGWDNMSSILDKEMPTKQKSKRILFWWICGTAAAIFVLIMGLSLNLDRSSNSITQTSTKIEDKKVVRKSDVNLQSSTPETTESNNIPNKTQTDNISANATFLESTLSTQTRSDISIIKNKTGSTIPNKSTNSFQSTSSQNTNSLNTYKINISNNTISSNIQDNPTNVITTKVDHTKEALSFTAICLAGHTPILFNPSELPFMPKVDIHGTSKFNLGLHLSYAYGSNQNYSEYGLGITGNLRINSSWSIISSLNYLRRNRLYNISSFDKSTLADAAIINSSQFTFSQDQLLESANEINLSQLTFQLGLEHQLSPKWAINSSLIPSYSIIDSEAYHEWYLTTIDPTGAVSDASNAFPKKWNAHLDFGLSYALTSQISLGLNYSYLTTRKGQGSLLNPNFESDELRLSVQYLLD